MVGARWPARQSSADPRRQVGADATHVWYSHSPSICLGMLISKAKESPGAGARPRGSSSPQAFPGELRATKGCRPHEWQPLASRGWSARAS